jgi:hypothetical protein
MPSAKKARAAPTDMDIDCADLDELIRMTAALMSASNLGNITLKEGYAIFRCIDKRMNVLERELRPAGAA